MAPPTKRARGGAGAAPTDKKYRRGSSSSWAGRGSGKRGGAASGRGGVKGQAIGGRGNRGGGAPRSAGLGRAPTKAARLERAGGAAAAATGRVDEEEEEWAGIQSSPEPEQEGQDSDKDEEDEEDEPAVRAPPPPPVKKQRKPTGGTGKKQKVFVEGKNDMLALAASVSGDVVKKAQEKVEKAKNKPVKAVEPKDRREPSDAKKNQIAAARAVVAARTKAKKDGNRVAAAEPAAPSAADPSASKKGVRFA